MGKVHMDCRKSVEFRAAVMNLEQPVKDLLYQGMHEAMENSICRAEGGFDTVEEIRAEIVRYRQYQTLVQWIGESGGKGDW